MTAPPLPLPAFTLDAASIVATLQRLEQRIAARFPDSGLRQVCQALVSAAQATARTVRHLATPYRWLRFVAGAVAGLWLCATAYVVSLVDWSEIGRRADPASLAQGLDSTVNLLLLAAAAIWFVLTAEQRLKRSRTIKALYALRSFAHVIDMHQLTKDPTIVLSGSTPTDVSPERRMSEFELARYLDYCAEMLALTGKLAALYAGGSGDSAVVGAVNEVEDLCSNLGRKIWQKIMILSQLDERRAVSKPGATQ